MLLVNLIWLVFFLTDIILIGCHEDAFISEWSIYLPDICMVTKNFDNKHKLHIQGPDFSVRKSVPYTCLTKHSFG